MRPTRRFWLVAALGGVLAGGAVLTERPVLLVGASFLGAWLLARQYAFSRTVAQLSTGLRVDLVATPRRVATGDDVQMTLTGALDTPTRATVQVAVTPPVAAAGSTAAERNLTLEAGTGDSTFAIRFETAGVYEFDPPTVSLTDRDGLFVTSFERGPTPELAVEPRAPREIHIGEGGEEVATAYGEHDAGQLGSGLEPAELRQYVAGDAANRIDWNATARLGEPYVREFEPETDRTTALVVDHRQRMRTGRDGRTKLDYAREVALAFLESARALDDPLGLYTVGDDGVTRAEPPKANPGHYRSIGRILRALRATAAEPSSQGEADVASVGRTIRTPAGARSAAEALQDERSPFARTLRPYFTRSDGYISRIEADPLFATIRTYLSRIRGTVWTVLLTDDSDPVEVRETVKHARRGDDHVAVFLTPTVLFEPGALSDLERAYERYLEFEEFRRSLARLDRVTAFEVAPSERLSAVLSGRRARREATQGRASSTTEDTSSTVEGAPQ